MAITRYLWDNVTDTVVMEKDGAGNTQAVYHSDPVPYGRLFSMRRSGKTSHYRYDGQGNTRALSDETGKITDTYRYDAFGNQRACTGTTVNPYRWGGQHGYQYDIPTQSYYIRQRVYEPSNGRWLSYDPEQFADGLNRFTYAFNNPIVHIDPSGLAAKCFAHCKTPKTDGTKVHDMAGFRGGKIDAVLHNWVGESLFGSGFLAKYYLENKSNIDKWWAPKVKVPKSRDCCYCCCTETQWVNVHFTSTRGTKKAINWLKKGKIAPLNKPFIDVSIPYKSSRVFRPCFETKAPNDPRRFRQYTMSDAPGLRPIVDFFNLGGTYFRQSFQSCVYCKTGIEEFRRTKEGFFMVIYCCANWGHFVEKKKGKVTVSRYINTKGKVNEIRGEWDLTGDNDKYGKRRVLMVSGGACLPAGMPTIDAISTGRTWPTPKTKKS